MENVKNKVAFSCAKIKKVQQQQQHCETDWTSNFKTDLTT